MADDSTTPREWAARLARKLRNRINHFDRHWKYYDGEQPLAFATSPYREEFALMLKGIGDNWCPLIIESLEERLHVEGFRAGEDKTVDRDAWEIWQRNGLDADSVLAHNAALIGGVAPVLVWPDEDGLAEITVEDPEQFIVATAPGNRRKRIAALKLWRDEWTDELRANVYLPEAIYKYKGEPGEDGAELVELETVPNPWKTLTAVELVNRPSLRCAKPQPTSELTPILTTQDQINKLVCDMIVAAEFSAYRQRWAIGVEIPDTDPDSQTDDNEQGERPDPWKAGIDRLWWSANPEARFGDFTETDLGNYVKAIENRVQSMASRTKTPAHYLLGSSGHFPSGESLRATETGLVAKVRERMVYFGEGWEAVIRIAGMIEDKAALAAAHSAETIWRDPESRTEAEHVDSLIKKVAIGVPMRQLWEDAGYSPQQIERFKAYAVEWALFQGLSQPPTAPPPPPAPASAPASAPA